MKLFWVLHFPCSVILCRIQFWVYSYDQVWGLFSLRVADMESISSWQSSQCFALAAGKVLLPCRCQGHCWDTLTLFLQQSPPHQEAGHGQAGRRHSQDSWRRDQKDIACHKAPAQQQQLRESRTKGQHSVFMTFVFWNNHCKYQSPASWEMARHCLLMGSRE